MTASVHALTRPADGGRPPLVPAKVLLREDCLYLRSDPGLLDTSWYRRCSDKEFRAANALRNRALKQQPAGSLPNDDAELAFLSDLGSSVTAWKRVKARALEGWILCADDRWHHPDIARNVLHIWIGRLERRRIGAWGNVSRAKDGGLYGLDSILEDLDEALGALREIDPQDAGLRDASEQQSKWWGRLEQVRLGTPSGESGESAGGEPIRLPNRMPIRTPPGGSPKVSEAKRSEPETEMPGRRPGHGLSIPEEEIGEERAPSPTADENRATYPPDAFEQFYGAFPLKVGRKRAKAAFADVQARGEVPFPALMSELDRYVRTKPPNQDWCHPVTWLNQDRWGDGAAARTSPDGAGRLRIISPDGAKRRVFVAVGTPRWRAWHDEAIRRGRSGWPSSMTRDGKRGWEFDSEWPPGVDPSDYGAEPRGQT